MPYEGPAPHRGAQDVVEHVLALRDSPHLRNGQPRPDPAEDPADGSALICCSHPSSDLAVEL